MPAVFQRVARPDPVVPDTTLDNELEKAIDDANLTLYFINLVVIGASGLANEDIGFDKSDPYCVVTVGEISDRTETMENNLNPVWNDKMSFFVPKKPSYVSFEVFDEDSGNIGIGREDDSLGVAKLDISELLISEDSYEGEVKLEKFKKGSNGKKVSIMGKKGKISIKLRCKVLKPIETEVKLGFVEKQLEGKGKEHEATVVALDESETLREEAINELSSKEQEVIKKAEELEEKQKLHQTELTIKEKSILDQAQVIENKIQQYEEAQVALMETEIKKKEVETKLTKAEEEILEKAKELELKERENADALTAKEKEILAAADKLEAKEHAYEETKKRMEQIEALKVEVENELTSKETIILQQAEELKIKENQHSEALTKAEKDILEKSKELEAKDAIAKAAQVKQDEYQVELNQLKQEYETIKAQMVEIENELSSKENIILQQTEELNKAKKAKKDKLVKKIDQKLKNAIDQAAEVKKDEYQLELDHSRQVHLQKQANLSAVTAEFRNSRGNGGDPCDGFCVIM